MIDAIAGSLVLAAGAAAGLASLGSRGPRFARVDAGGSSALLGPGVQHAAYGVLRPLGLALARVGLSANAITIASVPFALAAGVALGAGHFGVGALLAGASYGCDALDGVVARATGTAGDAGEVLDAVCDRICEALILGGVAFAWRGAPLLLALALLAALGAQQVTLASAKAEVFPAVREQVPRGMMRRAERAVYLVGGAGLAGVLLDLMPGASAAEAPLVVSMGLLALIGNGSAVHRFASLAKALRPRRSGVPPAAVAEVRRAGE